MGDDGVGGFRWQKSEARDHPMGLAAQGFQHVGGFLLISGLTEDATA